MLEIPNDIDILKGLVTRLWGRTEQLEAENDKLRRENADLRRRLGLNSENSDKPPSSDGYGKKPVSPGIPKKKHEKGGQKGHEGKTLERVETPDRAELHLPEQCDCCGRLFEVDESHEIVQSRQVFDLPQPKLVVTEHRIGQIECCGKAHSGAYPVGINGPVQYGPGVRSLVTMLSVDNKMPLEQISCLFADLYGYDLNSATILETLNRGYQHTEELEEATCAGLKKSEVVHFDETGVRVAEKLHWLHTASTSNSTHLFIHEKRGQEALTSEKSVLKDFAGIAVHDCFSSYFTFEKPFHSLCGAHLLRELNGLKENGSLWAGQMHEFLLSLHDAQRPIAMAQGELLRQYQTLLQQADQEETPPQKGNRGRAKQSPGRNLLNRLRTHQDGVLTFALQAGVPFTNNQAERDLRPSKVKLKVSGCFRTVEGARTYARIQAAISTFRKQDQNVFSSLRRLFSSPTPLIV
uniref:Transposase n=1 Tax=Candidatus Kentrum sp. DK TaxID=2126562 RepID=A0A450TDA9_9GAMM|nr:MAG: transposase [Candidatus Kentron sp. DK]